MGLPHSRRVKGAILFEAVMTVSLGVGVFFLGHLALVKLWRNEMIELQKERLSYDGVKAWSARETSATD